LDYNEHRHYEGFTMKSILTIEEIQRRYDGEWVLIAHEKLDENFEILKGEVLAHALDADTIYRSLALAKGREASIEYMGKVPADFVAIL
jgi:hypothetical protein